MVDKMSTMVIRESSDLNDHTDFDDELVQENMMDIEHHSHRIFNSKAKMDRRLVRAYQARRWRDDYKNNQGKSSAFEEIAEDQFVRQLTL